MKQFSEQHRKNLSIARRKRIIPPHSEEHKQKIRESCKGINKGSKNGMWKGEKVKYKGIHWWIIHNKPKPDLCENCKLVPPYDAANISGKYLRDLNDWQYLCRSCHMKLDNRILNLKQYRVVVQ